MPDHQRVHFGILSSKQSTQLNGNNQQSYSKKQNKKIRFKKPSDPILLKKHMDAQKMERMSKISTIESGFFTLSPEEGGNKNFSEVLSFSAPPPNGGWGWVVVFSSFLINVLIIGMHNSFSFLLLNLKNDFNSSLSETSGVGSMAFGSILLFAPLSGFLANIYGCQVVALSGTIIATLGLYSSSYARSLGILYFTYGLAYGFGTSLCYVQGTVMVTRYFTTKKALASGIALSGSSLGALIMAPIYYNLQSSVGWRKALRIISSLTILTVLCAATYKPIQKPGTATAEERIMTSPARKIVKDFSLWKNKAFLIWAFAVGLNKFGYLVPWVHMGKLSMDANIKEFGPRLIQFMGLASTISRLIIGRIVDLPQINRQYVAQISSFLMGIANIIQAYTRNKSGMTVYACLLGSLDGGVEILLPIMTLDLVGAENLSIAWGCILAVISLSSLGPPIAGQIRDSTGSYFWAFYLTGVPMILAALVLFLIPWAKRQHQEPTTSILSIHPSHLEIKREYEQEQKNNNNQKIWRDFLFGQNLLNFYQTKPYNGESLDNFISPDDLKEWKPYQRPTILPGT